MPDATVPTLTGKGNDSNADIRNQKFQEIGLDAEFSDLANRFLERFYADTAIFLPRTTEEQRPLVSEWFTTYKPRFLSVMTDLFRETFPRTFAQKGAEGVEAFYSQYMWPLLEMPLRDYVLSGIAMRWASRRYPDSVGVFPPERVKNGWLLPLRTRTGQTVGQIVLDEEGNVILPETTKAEQIREQLGYAV